MSNYSLIVPVYNEEKIIQDTVSSVTEYADYIKNTRGIGIDVIFLDDGSTDFTPNILDNLVNVEGYDIKVIHDNGPSRRENLVKQMLNTNTKYVGFMDCDLATDINDLENLITNIPNYDIVTGDRYAPSSNVDRSIDRKIISVAFNYSMRQMFGSKMRDHECGFKMFKKDSLEKIVEHTGYGDDYKERKMFWDTEMLVYAQKMGYKILEVPVNWKAGKKSALRFKTELSMIPYILKFWYDGKWKLPEDK